MHSYILICFDFIEKVRILDSTHRFDFLRWERRTPQITLFYWSTPLKVPGSAVRERRVRQRVWLTSSVSSFASSLVAQFENPAFPRTQRSAEEKLTRRRTHLENDDERPEVDEGLIRRLRLVARRSERQKYHIVASGKALKPNTVACKEKGDIFSSNYGLATGWRVEMLFSQTFAPSRETMTMSLVSSLN